MNYKKIVFKFLQQGNNFCEFNFCTRLAANFFKINWLNFLSQDCSNPLEFN